MFKDLVRHVAKETGLTQAATKAALGILLNAAERQGAPFADELFHRLPGARTLSARTGAELGCPNGVIARLIEQTPGGRRYVAAGMIRDLHKLGLGHEEIGALFPAIATYAEETYQITSFGHLGDMLGADVDVKDLVAHAA